MPAATFFCSIAGVVLGLTACLGPVDRVYDDQVTDPSQATHFVGGVVKGLKGKGLVLQNNGGESIALSEDGAFTFPTPLKTGDAYAVTIAGQPSGPSQTCTASSAMGTVGAANVGNIQITCVITSFKVAGNVTGLTGSGLTLRLEAAPGGGNLLSQDLKVTGDGAITFGTGVPSGYTYQITVLTQPTDPDEKCTIVSGGAAEIVDADVTNVALTCS